jgi:arginyl-tRNA synthetase
LNLKWIFHAFYEECRVSGDEHEQERMLLLRATEQVLGTGMKLLGVVVLDRM